MKMLNTHHNNNNTQAGAQKKRSTEKKRKRGKNEDKNVGKKSSGGKFFAKSYSNLVVLLCVSVGAGEGNVYCTVRIVCFYSYCGKLCVMLRKKLKKGKFSALTQTGFKIEKKIN